VFGVRLVVVGDGLEAEMICGLLRTADIPCNHRQMDAGIGAWDAVGPGGPHEVLVGADDLDAAKEIVAEALSGP
jgi:Putative prokaryotic signal transducing protein